MTRAIAGAGTPEDVWVPFLCAADLPELDLGPLLAAPRVLVLAAHPDDEVLAVGGLCARLSAARPGVRLAFVWATDGEASHPGAPAEAVAGLGARRRVEARRALDHLAVHPSSVTHLALPDSGLAARVDELTATLGGFVGPGDVVLAPWRADGHPDHEACGAAAAVLVGDGRLLEYPVWAWHWGDPRDGALPWHRARRVALTADEAARKVAAIAAFQSQVEPLGAGDALAAVLPPHVVARFTRGTEVVFEAPR